jgi:hypothetical protein
LFGVVQDAGAGPKARRKAALKIADFLLPKVAKKPKISPDEYGFVIKQNLVDEYRAIERELRALVNSPTRKVPAIAEKIKKLAGAFRCDRTAVRIPVSYHLWRGGPPQGPAETGRVCRAGRQGDRA